MAHLPVRSLLALGLFLAPFAALADDSAKRLLFDAFNVLRSGNAPADAVPAPAAGPTGPNVAVTASAPQPGCPRLGRLSSAGVVGPRPASYEPAVLWPANAHCELHSFRDLQFPEAAEQKRAFSKIGEIPCKTCERGFHFDDWPKNMPEAKLLELKPGQPMRWKGARYQGAVVLTGEHPIGSFPCKQYRWTLSEGGQVAAERHGLFCHYKVPGFTVTEWYQVL